MNIYDYKEQIKINIANFLEGFLIKNSDNRNITEEERIEYLLKYFHPEIRNFYKEPNYRNALNKYINEIRLAYENLNAYEIEFAGTNEELDSAILVFENKLKTIILDFQERVYEVIKGKEGYQTSTVKSYINDIKIKLIKDDNDTEKGLEKLKDVVPALYIMHTYIQNKSEILFAYSKYIDNTYEKGTAEHKEGTRNYFKMLNITDYEKFIDFYNKIPVGKKPIMEEAFEEVKPKSRG